MQQNIKRIGLAFGVVVILWLLFAFATIFTGQSTNTNTSIGLLFQYSFIVIGILAIIFTTWLYILRYPLVKGGTEKKIRIIPTTQYIATTAISSSLIVRGVQSIFFSSQPIFLWSGLQLQDALFLLWALFSAIGLAIRLKQLPTQIQAKGE